MNLTTNSAQDIKKHRKFNDLATKSCHWSR